MPHLPNDQHVVAARTTCCQLVGKEFTLEEGTRVKVVESLPRLKCLRVSYNRQTGVFPVSHFRAPDFVNAQREAYSSRNSHRIQNEANYHQLSAAFHSH